VIHCASAGRGRGVVIHCASARRGVVCCDPLRGCYDLQGGGGVL
jgi:hypothetical protein